MQFIERVHVDHPLIRRSKPKSKPHRRLTAHFVRVRPRPADGLFNRQITKSEVLFCAISLRHTKCFRALAPSHPIPKAFPILNGFDARCIAAATNQYTFLQQLKHSALDLNAPCEDYDVHSGKLRQIITPQMMASWFGAPGVVHFLVAQRDINQRPRDSRTVGATDRRR